MTVVDSEPQGPRTEFKILLHDLENTSVNTEGVCILFEYKIKVAGKLHFCIILSLKAGSTNGERKGTKTNQQTLESLHIIKANGLFAHNRTLNPWPNS